MDRGTLTSAQLSGGAEPQADESQDPRPAACSQPSSRPAASAPSTCEEFVLESHIILGEN